MRAPTMQRRIAEYVVSQRDPILGFLQELIGFRTESQDPSNSEYLGEAVRCLDHVQRIIEPMGFEVKRWDAAASTFPRHPVLAGQLRGAGVGRSIALNGHVDVVPAGDLSRWTSDPWAGQLREGKIFGRGACDMKGGVAMMIMAVKALSDLGLQLKGDIWLHLVTDEEVVGWGSRECTNRLPHPDLVLCPEPTSLQIVTTEGGLEHFRLEVTGRATHAGQRWTYTTAGSQGEGASAIDKMLKIVGALQDLERLWARKSCPPFPPGFNSLMPGIIVGGPGGGHDGLLTSFTNPGTTPDYCSVEYNLWFYPDQSFDQVREEIEDYVGHVCQLDPWLKQHPPRITWHLRNIYFPPAFVAPDHPFVDALRSFRSETGSDSGPVAFSAVCDIAWYHEQGVPGIVFGPGSLGQAHSPDEFVPAEEVLRGTSAIALALLDWCGQVT
jgi:acetylornithine deacetylase/succinyl-diaminopimelate desuccinylase family protein